MLPVLFAGCSIFKHALHFYSFGQTELFTECGTVN